jgi:DNA polymerase-1
MAKTLYILDGHSHLYAAYYAIRTLSSPSGEPTNAVYGMTSVALKIVREHQPDYIIAVFDPPGKTFRDEIYAEYKAHRPPMPDDMVPQVTRIRQVLEALGVPVLMVNGFEADDVIATLTRKALSEGLEVVIASKDKDLEQLLGEQVRLYDSTNEKFTDAETLKQEKGISPDQVIDVLALVGDTADNVPGIPGVGPKTAVKMIHEYGNMDNMIAHRDKLPAKAREFLSEPTNAEKLKLSQTLVTLRYDAPLEFMPQAWRAEIPDKGRLAALFAELGFNRFIQQLGLETPEPLLENHVTVTEKPTFSQVRSLEELEKLVRRFADEEQLSVDTETTSPEPMRADLVGISLCCDESRAYYVPLRSPDCQHLPPDKALGIVRPLLEDPKIEKIGQNLKYDQIVLRNAGIELAGIAFDTMIASYVLDPSRLRHNLDHLAETFLGYKTIKITELIGTGRGQLTMDQVATQRVTDYAAEDALVAFRLARVFEERLRQENLRELFQTVEMPLVAVLADMEYNGVTIDTEKLSKLSGRLTRQLDQLTGKIHEAVGRPFNIDSPKQLANVLFDELKLSSTKMTKTGRSTDVSVLEQLAWQHPVPKLVLEYRQLAKLKNTYVDKLPAMLNPRTGKIHTSFNQAVTATGRLSCSDPNLQNIPIRSEIGRQIRSAFVPADRANDVLLTCDYSQVELRLLAHLSGDENLVRAFKEDHDIHAFVASQIFDVDIAQVTEDQRRVAKTVNFGIIYGQTPHGLAQTLGASRGEAQTFISSYFKRYAQAKRFIDECINRARESGQATTILGRRRPIPEIASRTPALRNFGERTAVNTVVQGSAADMIKIAMVNIHQQIKAGRLSATMLIQVHDELVFEVPKTCVEDHADKISGLMSHAIDLAIPLKVDATWGGSWLEEE